MTRKNTIGRTVCFGVLATAAATMLMANTVAFAAGPGEESAEISWEGDHISGKVTDVSSDSITVSVFGARPGSGKGMAGDDMNTQLPDGETPPELPEGQTPPERPEGGQHDGQNPPELPDGQTPPERPEGEQPDGERPEFSDGERPEPPEGMGENPMNGQPETEVTVKIDSSTVITKGTDAESAALSDIAAGSMVMISLDGDTAVSIMIFDLPA